VNTRILSFVVFFVMLMIAPKIVEPAYDLFLVAFAMLMGLQSEWHGIPLRLRIPASIRTLLAGVVLLIILDVTFNQAPAARDVLRDLGALLAFFVGRYMFVAYRDKDFQTEALIGMSHMGVIVSLYTIGAALLAYAAGVSAYLWRGAYVPWAHTWLPFVLVTNVFLAAIDREHATRWQRRAALSVLATVASLSRTDLLLDMGFGLAMLWSYREQFLLRFAGILKIAGVLMVVAAATPFLLKLDVVQQRISRGVGDSDQSLGWRFLENVSLFDHFMRASNYELAFGFGLGARLPLPPGILDFDGNTSIPNLHNSLGTIALKFGIMGLVILAWYAWRVSRKSFTFKDPAGEPYRRAGRWIVLLCFGKALTLHGLTEWGHVVFFGIGCMLMLNHTRDDRVREPVPTASTSPAPAT